LIKKELKDAELHTGVLIYHNDAFKISTLEEPGIKNTDLLIAISDSETTNINITIHISDWLLQLAAQLEE